MKVRTIFALTLLWPIIAISGNVATGHSETPISQEFPAPACLGLPEGATISEDFLHVLDVTIVSTGRSFTRVIKIESNGTASANDGAWMWDIRMHASQVGVLSLDGSSASKETLMQVRNFISTQQGVPNLQRTVKVVVVANPVREGLVVEINPDFSEFDFVCTS